MNIAKIYRKIPKSKDNTKADETGGTKRKSKRKEFKGHIWYYTI